MNNYLIPANSKKSQLILGLFNTWDLIILIGGIIISGIALFLKPNDDLMIMVLLALPALIAVFLVLPIPNYHNIRTLIGNGWSFITGNKTYYWKGWCACYGDRESKR